MRCKFDLGFGFGDAEEANFAWDLEIPIGTKSLGVKFQVGQSRRYRAGGPPHPMAGAVSAQNVEIHLDSLGDQH